MNRDNKDYFVVRHYEAVAARKAGVPGWECSSIEAVSLGVLMAGQEKNRAPVFVSRQEHDEEFEHYEKETANCGYCFGEKEVVIGWNVHTGVKKSTCPACGGSGKSRV